jgi:DNA-binding transcriptional regulator YiaG
MSFQTRRETVHRARRTRRARPPSRKSLGERLCDWREANDLSQSEAAMKLKISKRTLQEWEQGRAEPRHLAMEAVIAVISR